MGGAREGQTERILSKRHPKRGMVSLKESDHGLLKPLSRVLISSPMKSPPPPTSDFADPMVEKPAPTVPVARSILRQKVGSYSLGPVRYVIPEAEAEEDFILRVAPVPYLSQYKN